MTIQVYFSNKTFFYAYLDRSIPAKLLEVVQGDFYVQHRTTTKLERLLNAARKTSLSGK